MGKNFENFFDIMLVLMVHYCLCSKGACACIEFEIRKIYSLHLQHCRALGGISDQAFYMTIVHAECRNLMAWLYFTFVLMFFAAAYVKWALRICSVCNCRPFSKHKLKTLLIQDT